MSSFNGYLLYLKISLFLVLASSCGGSGNTRDLEENQDSASSARLIGHWEETFDDLFPDQVYVDGKCETYVVEITGDGICEGYAFYENGNYEYYDQGVPEDYGTYIVSNNFIVFDSSIYMASFSNRFDVSNDLLISYFDDGSGGSDRFVRAPLNP